MCSCFIFFFFFNDTATTEIYTLSLHDALPIPAAIWRSWPCTTASSPYLRGPALSTSSPNSRLLLASSTAVLLGGGVALGLLWAPEDADQGPSQRIFYLHVPIALTAYAMFGWAAWKALRLLWTGEPRYDLESYTAVHMGTIFGTLTLVTGSIWARTSRGVWWIGGERQLVLFLVLFLFYGAYFMLRYSLAEGPARARISAVYALFGVVLIPISFLAIRLAENFIHPVVF